MPALALAGGTVETYYLTRHLTDVNTAAQSQVVVLQGTAVTNQFANPYKPTNRWELALTVLDDVRTVGYHFRWCCPWTDTSGARYLLNGGYIGPTYSLPVYGATGATSPAPVSDTLDSATDGVFNYLVSATYGDVIRTNREFTNPVVLFHISDQSFGGITYDGKTGTLWLSGWANSTLVRNYDMQGNKLAEFSTGHVTNTALAYETATDTLWLERVTSLDPSQQVSSLEQWSKTGQLLQTVPNLWAFYGGEMLPTLQGMPAAGCLLWPPNGKMVEVAHVTPVTLASMPGVTNLELKVASDEPVNPKKPDFIVTPDGEGGFVVQLRAARLGAGDGRLYTITATGTDAAGNPLSVTSTCAVPHDQGQ